MTALAQTIYVDGERYAAGTDHTAMPALAVDRTRNPNAWVGGVVPALSRNQVGKQRIAGADLTSATRGRAALGAVADDDSRLFAPGSMLSRMTVPMRTAHRTGGTALGSIIYGPAPENTLEGARMMLAAASGFDISNFVLNLQCRRLADGSIGVVHDATVDRTATGVGNVADFTIGAWMGLSMDAATYTGAPAWGDNLKFPLLDDFLQQFGGRVAMNIAAYSVGNEDVGAIIARKVVARGLQRTVMVGSFSQTQLLPARDAGIATIYYPPDEGNAGSTAAAVSALNLWAPGLPKYVGVSSASSDAYVQSFIAAGFHLSAYFTCRRYDRDRLLALGVHGLISDDPIYQFTNTRLYTSTTSDPYTMGAWPHGALPGDNRNRGTLTTAGQKLDDLNNPQFSLQGGRCPLPTPTAYTMNCAVKFDTIGTDASRSAQLIFACPDDRVTSGVPNSGAGLPDGYTLLVRANGNVELYKDTRSGQGNVKIGSTLSTTAVTQGATVTFTLQVTATQIIFTRTDAAATTTWTDSSYRGAYYHVGKSGNSGSSLGVTWQITGLV